MLLCDRVPSCTTYSQQSTKRDMRGETTALLLWASGTNWCSRRYLWIDCIVLLFVVRKGIIQFVSTAINKARHLRQGACIVLLLLCNRIPSCTYSQQSTKRDIRCEATASSLWAFGANQCSKQSHHSVAVFEVAMWDNQLGLQGEAIALSLWASGTNRRLKQNRQINCIVLLLCSNYVRYLRRGDCVVVTIHYVWSFKSSASLCRCVRSTWDIQDEATRSRRCEHPWRIDDRSDTFKSIASFCCCVRSMWFPRCDKFARVSRNATVKNITFKCIMWSYV